LPEGYPCKDLLVSTESEAQCNRLYVAYSIAVIPFLLDSRTLIFVQVWSSSGLREMGHSLILRDKP